MIPCGKCGRALTSEKSVLRGVGPSCARLLGDRIRTLAQSSGRSERLEAEVALALGNDVVTFHKEFVNDKGQLIGDIDVATKEAIVEVTNAKNGKLRQLRKYRSNLIINPEGKSVVLYAPHYRYSARKDIISEGFRWTGNEPSLKSALAKVKSWREKNVEQALVLTKQSVNDKEFRQLMEEFGGELIGDDEFSFTENGAKFTVVLDSHTAIGEQTDEEVTAKLQGAPTTCLNIQCGHGVSVEQMRSFIVRLVSRVDGVAEIDDLGVFNLDDIEQNQF